MRCAFEVGKQYKAIGVTKTFCFSLQVIFLFNFFLFSNDFLVPKKMWLRTRVDSRYHGGGPTQVNQVNQAWHVILFFAPSVSDQLSDQRRLPLHLQTI